MAAGALPAAFVINRTRVRDVDRFTARCAAVAAARGWRPSFLSTDADDHGTGLARGAIAGGTRLIFAVGGDGTVRACVQALAGTGIPLAIVPRGTANLVARSLGVPSRLEAALAVGFAGRERRIDLAETDGMAFAAMAGIGVDAAVVGATRGPLKQRAGWVAYAATGTGHLLGRQTRFTVRLDGGAPVTRAARAVVAGNAGLLPGGFVLLPAARLDDGVLDVGILAPAGVLGWARVGYRVLARSPRDDCHLERYQARQVEIRAVVPLPRQVDGELIGGGQSLTVTVRPGALLVRVPPAAPPPSHRLKLAPGVPAARAHAGWLGRIVSRSCYGNRRNNLTVAGRPDNPRATVDQPLAPCEGRIRLTSLVGRTRV